MPKGKSKKRVTHNNKKKKTAVGKKKKDGTVPLSAAGRKSRFGYALPQYGGLESPFHDNGMGLVRGNVETISIGGKPLREATLNKSLRKKI